MNPREPLHASILPKPSQGSVSSSDLLAALDCAPDGISITAPSGRYIYVNQAHCRMFGYARSEQVLGRSWRMLFPAQFRSRITRDAMPALRQVGFWIGRLPGKHRDGSIITQQVALRLLPGRNVICMVFNATERFAGDDLRDRLFALSQGMLAVADTSGCIKQFNPAWSTLLGYDPEDIRDHSILEFVHPDDRDFTQAKLVKLREGRPTRSFVNRMCTKSGSHLWLNWSASSSPGDNLIFASAHDVTDTKRAESAVVAGIAQSCQTDQQQARFAAMASHELRTPLANIMLASQLLKNHFKELPEHLIEHLFGEIQSTIRDMTSTIDSLLFAGNVDMGRVDFRPAAVSSVQEFEILIRNAISQPSSRIVIIIREFDGEVLVDRALFAHVLRNLVENGLKYSPAPAPVHVIARVRSGRLSFFVADRGIGVPVVERRRLFEAFFRSSNVGSTPGFGLGLFIADRAARLHGGVIRYRPREGGGALFVVRLPMRRNTHREQGD
nr:PAS domain-containing sensor histidine kinase [Terrimicrobium sacchariphilum]